ncbi:MG284/MPN403 family protein [Mycoplasma hafezii]|uniref:MG284/MPN403 family protein n=1 Tax=Mycoplasma hafezii TaxID=525886 RepID=UPI003CF7DF46
MIVTPTSKVEDDDLYEQQLKFLKEVFLTDLLYKKQLKYELFKLRYESLRDDADQDKIKDQERELEAKIQGKGSVIELILSLMDTDKAWLIKKCYWDSESKINNQWYLEYFSKTTFYKRKREAVKQFVDFYFSYGDE